MQQFFYTTVLNKPLKTLRRYGGEAIRHFIRPFPAGTLYMCSMSAIRYNKSCKEKYDRLKENGKKGKLALIAVSNKLLRQAFAVATKEVPYQEGHIPECPVANKKLRKVKSGRAPCCRG